MKYSKLSVVAGCLLVLCTGAWAQNKIRLARKMSPNQRAHMELAHQAETHWRNKILANGGRSYLTPNVQVARALTTRPLPRIGESAWYVPALRLSEKIRPFASTHLSEKMAELLLVRSCPGYYVDFPSSWREHALDQDFSLSAWIEILSDAYGPEVRFAADFLPSLRDVYIFRLAVHRVQWQSVEEVLPYALRKGQKLKSGFFVVAVFNVRTSETDVLLLDVANRKFISLNESMQAAQQVPAKKPAVDPATEPADPSATPADQVQADPAPTFEEIRQAESEEGLHTRYETGVPPAASAETEVDRVRREVFEERGLSGNK